MTFTPLPSYRRPPVSEVAAGILFSDSIPGFQIPHIGKFWEKVKDEFPQSEHFTPIIVPGLLPKWLDSATGFPLPRIWLLSAKKDSLIQLQGDCFFFNWRKSADTDVYPRYPAIIARFEDLLNRYLEFLKEANLPAPEPRACELSYINHIPQGAWWKTVEDLGRILRDFCWCKDDGRFLPIPKNATWAATFDLPEKAGTLTARLNQITRISDSLPAIRLDLTAQGIGENKSIGGLRPWFDLSRDSIVRGFTDLTTPWAQKELWEREDA